MHRMYTLQIGQHKSSIDASTGACPRENHFKTSNQDFVINIRTINFLNVSGHI